MTRSKDGSKGIIEGIDFRVSGPKEPRRTRRWRLPVAIAATAVFAALYAMEPRILWFRRGTAAMTPVEAQWVLQQPDADRGQISGACVVLLRDVRRNLIAPLAEHARGGDEDAMNALRQIRALADEAMR